MANLVDRKRSIFSKGEQQDLTPQGALDMLKAGNERYVTDQLTNYHQLVQIPQAKSGQFPKAIILSCVDSRVPVEMVFDQGIGDIFVARVAGNFANVDIMGSMEFACGPANSKLVVVLGHEACGAIKAAAEVFGGDGDPKPLPDNLTEMAGSLKPAVEATPGHEGCRKASNDAFVADIVNTNVKLTMAKIRNESAALKKLEDDKKILIVGAVYSLTTGRVTFLEDCSKCD